MAQQKKEDWIKDQPYVQSGTAAAATGINALGSKIKFSNQNGQSNSTFNEMMKTNNLPQYKTNNNNKGVNVSVNPNINKQGLEEKPASEEQPAAQAAEETISSIADNKPQGYTSKYSDQLNAILQQIQNPDKFKWDFNGDELFKYYADLYTQNGRQASMDAMGQAAALTGGYGNSYAQQVGNQAYDEYLRNLYDKGFELRDNAYQQYRDSINDLYNQFGLVQSMDETDYNRYADNRDFDENVRQFNEKLDWDKLNSDQSRAASYVQAILANGMMPSEEMLKLAGMSTEDAKKMMAQLTPTVTVGGGGGGKKKDDKGGTTTYYTDTDGNFYSLNDGNYVMVDPVNIKDTDLINTSKSKQIPDNISRELLKLYSGLV